MNKNNIIHSVVVGITLIAVWVHQWRQGLPCNRIVQTVRTSTYKNNHTINNLPFETIGNRKVHLETGKHAKSALPTFG